MNPAAGSPRLPARPAPSGAGLHEEGGRRVGRLEAIEDRALQRLFILPAVRGLLAGPFVRFKDATVEERPQRLLGALADLLDPDLTEARTDVPPVTAPHLMAVGFGRRGGAAGDQPRGCALDLPTSR